MFDGVKKPVPPPRTFYMEESLQRAPLGLTLGFVISFYVSSTGRLAILQLLSSQARKKMLEELLKRK